MGIYSSDESCEFRPKLLRLQASTKSAGDFVPYTIKKLTTAVGWRS